MSTIETNLTNVQVRQTARRVAYFDTTLPADLADAFWHHPDNIVARGTPLRAVGTRRTVKHAHGSQEFVLKHYLEPTWRHSLKQLVQPSRAWRTWRIAHYLADAGIATPRPVGCVELRWGPLRRDSYLMYPLVPGRQLKSFFSRRAKTDPELRQRLWTQLEDLWQRLEQIHASLGDANLGNFIVAPDGRLWVIDLDKARIHHFAAAAARHQQRRWKQVLRSTAKHGRFGVTTQAA